MALRSNTTIQEKYITISIHQKTEDDAKRYFQRIGVDLNQQFARLGSRCEELTLDERLKICYDFYNAGSVNKFMFKILSVWIKRYWTGWRSCRRSRKNSS